MTPRVHAEWRNRVAAEYRSAALAAGVVRGAIIAGFPAELLHTALRIVRDELDHAALSHQALVALGGGAEPVPLQAADLAGQPGDVLGDLVDSVVRDFCLGETFAVPLFAAMRRDTRHPAVLPVLTRILADEAVHRQFGWDALDALLERHLGVRERVEAALPRWIGGVRAAYAAPPDPEAAPLSEGEREAGLLEVARYREIFWDTVRTDVARRFAARGVAVPREYAGAE